MLELAVQKMPIFFCWSWNIWAATGVPKRFSGAWAGENVDADGAAPQGDFAHASCAAFAAVAGGGRDLFCRAVS